MHEAIAVIRWGAGGSMDDAEFILLVLTPSNPNEGYTLYDHFGTDLAAGNVNGSLADTGQSRSVIDTTNVISVSSGSLQIASMAGTNDPRLAYPSMTRVAGQMILAKYTPGSSALNRWAIGWCTSNSLASAQNTIYFFPSASLNAIDGGLNIVTGVFAVATYTVCIILRATGAFYFIKGGAFTFWTLFWVSSTGTITPMFPISGAIAASAGGGVEDDIRIPTTLYIPYPLAYDTFTRANGALGSTETASPDGLAIAPLVWNFTAGIWAIVSNAAVATPVGGADIIVNGSFAVDANWTKGAGWTIAAGVATFNAGAGASISETVGTVGRWYRATWSITAYVSGSFRCLIGSGVGVAQSALGTFVETGFFDAAAAGVNVAGAGNGSIDNVSYLALTTAELMSSVQAATPDVIASVAITSVSGACLQAGIVCNLDDVANPQNFVLAVVDMRGTLRLYDVVAGAYTLKISTAVTYVAGAVLQIVRSGTECRVFYNNAIVGTLQTMTTNTNTKHGLFSTSPLSSLDSFTLFARGTSGEYAGLDAF